MQSRYFKSRYFATFQMFASMKLIEKFCIFPLIADGSIYGYLNFTI